MKKALPILTILFAFVQTIAEAQTNPRYLVLFKDKSASPFSIEQPSAFLSERAISRRSRQNIPVRAQDLPVNPAYLTAIVQTGAKVIYPTRWFNGALVEASNVQLDAIKKLAFYKGIELDLPVANLTGPSPGILRTQKNTRKLGTTEELNYGNMNAQLALMDVPALHQKGFQGEGMVIAVIDNGFGNGDQVAFLQHLRDEKRIIDTHDFIAREANVYNDGTHGLAVLSTMAAYQPGTMIGAAFKATYALYRSESDAVESPYEEIAWLMAAERADSIGADVVNTSLGYSVFEGEFDTDAYNHTYEDLDGNTTIISKAARFATRTGMLVVNSAGNEGNDAWHYITAPADVDSVLTVGATRYDRSYAAFSSVGPNAAGLMKPDVSAVGASTVIGTMSGNAVSGNGTSYSSPLIAGLATILWQGNTNLTAQQIISVLKKSGHQGSAPDNLVGYGVPSATKAVEIIIEEFKPLGTEPDDNNIILSPNPADTELTLSIGNSLRGKTVEMSVFDLSGTRISGSVLRMTEKHVIPTGQLLPGLYVLKIKSDTYQHTLKFIRR